MAYFRKNVERVPPELVEKYKEEQRKLARKVVMEPIDFDHIELVAGADSAFIGENYILSVIVVLEFATMREVEVEYSLSEVDFPYIPGLLAFREAPNVLKTYEKLQNKPDLIMVDGHGISHFRRLGIASHIGVLLDVPTMGVAKKLLAGRYEEPCSRRGCRSPIIHNGEVVGYALRTRDNVQPVFVSPGHRTDLEGVVKAALMTTRGFRLPEPIRIADRYSKDLKRQVRP